MNELEPGSKLVNIDGTNWTGGPWHGDVVSPRRAWADVFQDRCLDVILVAFGALAAVGFVQRHWRDFIERVFG